MFLCKNIVPVILFFVLAHTKYLRYVWNETYNDGDVCFVDGVPVRDICILTQ